MVSDRRSPRHIPGQDETKIDKLARLSGRVASRVAGALERRGYDIRGKMSVPISQVRIPVRFPAAARENRQSRAAIEKTGIIPYNGSTVRGR
jgi:hypothetical protein